MTPLPYYSSQRQAAVAVGRPVEVIRQACAESPDVTRAAGRIDKVALAAWIEANDRERPDGNGTLENATLSELKRLRELVVYKRELLALDKARDAMLPVAHFETALGAMVGAFVATINQVPGRAAQKIVARARLAVLDMLRAALTEKQFEKIESTLDAASIEYGEIQQVIETELEHARATLAQCQFIASDEPATETQTAPRSPAAPRKRSGRRQNRKQ